MQFRELLQLKDGTSVMFSKLKYSGVHLKFETHLACGDGNVKYAMAVWPNHMEPLRFYEVSGYTDMELEVLRSCISKVGNLVLSLVMDEIERELNKEKEGLLAGQALLVFDKQLVGGMVAGFLNVNGEIQTLIPRAGEGTDFGILSLYDISKGIVVSVSTLDDRVTIKESRNGISYNLKNIGEQRMILVYENSELCLEPGKMITL